MAINLHSDKKYNTGNLYKLYYILSFIDLMYRITIQKYVCTFDSPITFQAYFNTILASCICRMR